ncbi:receptor-like serine/threonine-protein kinase SD1-7 isoform X2 [Zingiber officinale]|uniref:receptor-like serine/threonine-protein kinase SD1-7 isoform X2 n=1 Tax=Zingiber officinale TaxID=94328 RepID=UPI001C4BE850|nr:receptor-like serine/threonine-protein kinase SD1-7 isoform X2 [Zingiber officinale]
MKLFPSHLLKIVAVALFFLAPSSSSDTMYQNSALVNNQNLTSTGDHLFRLGFFSLDNSSANGYLGIWYCNLTPQEGTVVWIANRNKPVNKSMASFNFTSDGNLILFEEDQTVWSTGTRSTGLNYARLQLLDSGNLVLNDSNSILWQSFEQPNDSDTYLPGMKLGFNNRTNTSWQQVSWKNSTDPSPGDYIRMIRALRIPDLVIFNRSAKYRRSGLWNGHEFVGHPSMANSQVAINFTFVSNENETYYMANSSNLVLSRSVLCDNGTFQRWFLGTGEWQLLWSIPEDVCDLYNYCGRNKMCTKKYNGPDCQCLPGLKIVENGCQREKPLNCSSNQFSKVPNVKVPDTENATSRGKMNLDDCKNLCLNDCSCVAYAVISGSYGCITWTGDLLDIRTFDDEGRNDLYIRLDHQSTINQTSVFFFLPESSTKKHAWVAIAIPLLLGFFLLCGVGVLVRWKRNRASTRLLLQLPNVCEGGSTPDDVSESRSSVSIDSEDSRDLHNTDKGVGLLNTLGLLPSYDLCTIKNATNNFSDGNKLGEGGFGVVYKGQLEDGQRIAVKKLSRNSSQGPNEFQNELSLIAKLQHRNLVRLLGCCIEGAERLIVLEYMENKSLDAFIYDKTKSSLLDWQKRLDIIIGIARGLLYLHQDSILRVIHRDLKPSNILLDRDMTPKISDFGIARIAEGERDLADGTTRPIGTFGYMAPEYLSCGYFSFKSDVFSFGVIVLEILSGKRNRTFGQANSGLNLLQHTYRLWKEGRSLDILDDAVSCSYPTIKILRCIRMALLCVQDNYENRPTMTEVVMMLTSEDHLIPLKQPIITSTRSDGDYTTKEMSITITGR